ncbi:MAG: transposase, partial [Tepidisphaeraceae bacterium]
MLTCKSPRKVMLVAYHLASRCLPEYSSKFSRHDFTLAQLFACLVLKEQQKRSYREAEALLRDSPEWCRAIGMSKPPDHNTLCRAAAVLMGQCKVKRLLDAVARWAALTRTLGLSKKPLAVDSSCFEPRHVSRYFEFRRGRGRGNRGRRRKIKALPKLGISVAAFSHVILSAQTRTGGSADYALWEPLVFDAWRRVPNRRFTAVGDAGFDSESNHQVARQEMGLRSIIPPRVAWKTRNPPVGRWRRRMTERRLLGTQRGRRRSGYTQRWQVETVMSMIKRNLGSALGGKNPRSRERDLRLKVLTHNLMILRRRRRVETG